MGNVIERIKFDPRKTTQEILGISTQQPNDINRVKDINELKKNQTIYLCSVRGDRKPAVIIHEPFKEPFNGQWVITVEDIQGNQQTEYLYRYGIVPCPRNLILSILFFFSKNVWQTKNWIEPA